MIHKDLIDIGYKWCLKRCGFAFKELVTMNISGEIPDIIGFNTDGTFLLEAKISRIDFLKDKKKFFRINSECGMGDWRFFICPTGLLKKTDLPNMWGLIEVSENNKVRISYNPFGKGNIYSNWLRNKKSTSSEMKMLYSALRRLHLRKRIDEIYESPK